VVNGRLASVAAIAGVATFVVAVCALHLVQPDLNPRDEAVSYYVHGRLGWLLTVGLIALGLGSVSVVVGLTGTVSGRWAGTGRWLVGTWAVGVLLGGLFRADPRGNWSQPPSVSGMIHGNAAMLAFLALPLGALCLASAFRNDVRWRHESRLLAGLAVAAAISLILFAGSLIPVFVRPGPPVLLGLSERVLLAVYAAWLVAAGRGVARRGARSDAGIGGAA
jgi:hypothetical protein